MIKLLSSNILYSKYNIEIYNINSVMYKINDMAYCLGNSIFLKKHKKTQVYTVIEIEK